MTTRSNQPPQPNDDQPLSQPPAPAAPVFSTYYPRTPSHPSSSATSLKGCCHRLFLLISFLAFLMLAVVLIFILSVKPKKPHVDLQLVRVQYMNIAADNPIGTTASITLTIRLLFNNPNKVGIKYGEYRFTIMYRRIPLGKASVPGFFQEAHSMKQVVATISIDRMSLLQADAADLIRSASLYDRVDFRLLGDVRAKIRVMNFDTPALQVSVDCAIAISPRKQSLTYQQCGIRN